LVSRRKIPKNKCQETNKFQISTFNFETRWLGLAFGLWRLTIHQSPLTTPAISTFQLMFELKGEAHAPLQASRLEGLVLYQNIYRTPINDF